MMYCIMTSFIQHALWSSDVPYNNLEEMIPINKSNDFDVNKNKINMVKKHADINWQQSLGAK